MAARRLKAGETVQLDIPGLSRSDKVARPPKLSEKNLQQQVRQTLANLGYHSFETGSTRARVTCPKCKHSHFPTGWQGNTVGVPDLLFYRQNNFPPVAALVELKAEGGEPSPAQQHLADAGRSVIAYSIREVIEAILAMEERMSAYQTPPERIEQLRRYLKINQGRI